MKKTIIIEATEAYNPERRGIGMQMRSWLELAPFTDFPHLQFVIASRKLPKADPLHVHAPNVRQIAPETDIEEAYIDYLYDLEGDLIFFPLAIEKYVRQSPVKRVGVDYGMEDFYCRNYTAPRPIAEIMHGHESAMRHYTSIITVSKTSQRDLAWFFPEHAGKVMVVYPGSPAPDKRTDEDLPVPVQGMQYFLVIGYEHKKNIVRIASAFDAFKQRSRSHTKLVIAGNPGYGGAEIDSHISSLASAADIVRLGYVATAQKQLLIEHCHAVVALSVYEGFGISALEGLEAGKIVLVSNNGSLKEVVGKAGYLADPFSVSSIAKQFAAIDGLSENPKQQYIQSRLRLFDQRAQAERLLRHLDTVA